jgi:hypothetical protein
VRALAPSQPSDGTHLLGPVSTGSCQMAPHCQRAADKAPHESGVCPALSRDSAISTRSAQLCFSAHRPSLRSPPPAPLSGTTPPCRSNDPSSPIPVRPSP